MGATAEYAPINWPVTFEKIISIALVAAAIVFFSPREVGEAVIFRSDGVNLPSSSRTFSVQTELIFRVHPEDDVS